MFGVFVFVQCALITVDSVLKVEISPSGKDLLTRVIVRMLCNVYICNLLPINSDSDCIRSRLLFIIY